jgi:DNA (cytosine-5)-methyltransferase 1
MSLTLATGNDQVLAVDQNAEEMHGHGDDRHTVAFEPGSIARNAGPAGESPQCPTLRSDMGDNQPAVREGMAVRRLTPTECERLQGFPDGWTNGQSDSARYRQLGNAVCVNVAEWIGRRIMAVAL